LPLGDFGVLVHGGWSRSRALLLNALSPDRQTVSDCCRTPVQCDRPARGGRWRRWARWGNSRGIFPRRDLKPA
jgi:hypothetical protein